MSDIQQLCKDVTFIKEWITGNGDPSKGMIVRMDRLEQTEAKRSLYVGTAVVAAIGSGVAAAWSVLTGRH